MRHLAVFYFFGLVAALVLWAGAAALTPHSELLARRSMMGSGLLAGPSARGWMHGWGGAGPYVLSQSGAAPHLADVERAMHQWIALEGNPRLTLGPLIELDSSNFRADIVTTQGSLVQRFNIDRRNGRITPVED